MKITVYRVATGAEKHQTVAWYRTRQEAIRVAARQPAGHYQVDEATLEADTWAGLALEALNCHDNIKCTPVASVEVSLDGEAQCTEKITRTVKA